MDDVKRRWHIVVHDSDGEAWTITDDYIFGSFSELSSSVNQVVDRWEAKTGLVAEKIELESHGKLS